MKQTFLLFLALAIGCSHKASEGSVRVVYDDNQIDTVKVVWVNDLSLSLDNAGIYSLRDYNGLLATGVRSYSVLVKDSIEYNRCGAYEYNVRVEYADNQVDTLKMKWSGFLNIEYEGGGMYALRDANRVVVATGVRSFSILDN